MIPGESGDTERLGGSRRLRRAMSDGSCWWCAEPGEYLCDMLLFPAGTMTTEAIALAETCDATMCAAHAKVVGFMCSSGPSPLCGAPTKKGGTCERVTGGSRCRQHANVELEAPDPEVHACPFCASRGVTLRRDVDPQEHRRDARAHGGRAQMGVVHR